MQFGKLGKFIRSLGQKDIQQAGVRDQDDAADPKAGPITITIIISGDQYYVKSESNFETLSDPLTRYVFGEFCMLFKDSVFETAMKSSIENWAVTNNSSTLKELIDVVYSDRKPKKLVEPLKFNNFNFEK